jgi:hypothetical protein
MHLNIRTKTGLKIAFFITYRRGAQFFEKFERNFRITGERLVWLSKLYTANHEYWGPGAKFGCLGDLANLCTPGAKCRLYSLRTSVV